MEQRYVEGKNQGIDVMHRSRLVYQKRLFLTHFFYWKCQNSKVLTPKNKYNETAEEKARLRF